MNHFYLIGNAHLDIDSYVRLETHFTALQPAMIGIENTENDFRKMLAAAQSNEAVSLGIRNWMRNFPSANAETVSLLVQNQTNEVLMFGKYFEDGKLIFCDNPAVVESPGFEHALESELKQSSELEELVRLTPIRLRQEITKEYAQKTYPVSDNPSYASFLSQRDAFTEGILRQQLPLKKHPIIYICGLDHLYGNYNPNLYDRLADLSPVRRKLVAVHA